MKVIEGNVASPLGFSADGLHAGFKKRKLDFGWIVSEVPASVAGVYTTNKVIAAPLIVTRNSIKKAQKMKANRCEFRSGKFLYGHARNGRCLYYAKMDS